MTLTRAARRRRERTEQARALRAQDGVGQLPVLRYSGEPGDGDAIGEAVGDDACGFEGQAGLSDAAGSEDGDQPVPLEQ